MQQDAASTAHAPAVFDRQRDDLFAGSGCLDLAIKGATEARTRIGLDREP